jgi:branched-chain amino acid transport system permease protein
MNIATIRIIVWITASCMAAAAGVLLSPVESVFPTVGSALLLQGFAVVILGGLGSIPGALIGGFALGFINSFTMTYLGTYSYLFAFGIIMLVIILRPQGLLGRR